MSDFKTSLDEYTREEKEQTGNMVYGGKRHDEICDYLQHEFDFSEEQINDISMGVWMGIESERRVSEELLKNKEKEIQKLKELFYQALGWMHAEACVALDVGRDMRKEDISEMCTRAEKDLGLK